MTTPTDEVQQSFIDDEAAIVAAEERLRLLEAAKWFRRFKAATPAGQLEMVRQVVDLVGLKKAKFIFQSPARRMAR